MFGGLFLIVNILGVEELVIITGSPLPSTIEYMILYSVYWIYLRFLLLP